MLRFLCRWDELAEVDAKVIDRLEREDGAPANPFGLINLPVLQPEQHRQAGERFAAQQWQRALATPPLARTPPAPSPLRVGYLSCDFHDHATLHLLMGVLEAHDTAAVQVQLFDHSPKRDDAFTRRLAELPMQRHDISHVSDSHAAQLIADQHLHLLIDLKGYTTKARLGICAHRPAPVIVNWLGYPGSLGHPRLADYIIGDPTVTPAEHAAHFSEHIAQMPHCYQPNDRLRPLPESVQRSEAGLPEHGIVFCNFNQAMKFNPREFALWCNLLQHTPGSLLWLLEPAAVDACANLRAALTSHGIASDRLIFAPRLEQAQHISRLALADIALDSFPYTSHTTGSDALWAGVPLVARMGSTFASRVSASLLRAHGFDELVAKDETDHHAKLIALAHDAEHRATLRQRLQQARLSSPLFDTTRFTRDLEALYAAIWNHHVHAKTGEAPVTTNTSTAAIQAQRATR